MPEERGWLGERNGEKERERDIDRWIKREKDRKKKADSLSDYLFVGVLARECVRACTAVIGLVRLAVWAPAARARQARLVEALPGAEVVGRPLAGLRYTEQARA